IQANANRLLNRNLLVVSKGKLRKKMESLPYVDSVSFRFDKGVLVLDGKLKERGVVVSDGGASYFHDEVYFLLDEKDVPGLVKEYSLVRISPDFLQFCRKYGFPADFSKMAGALGGAKSSSNLITIADYDNNKSNILTGTLRVKFEDVESLLVVNDLRDEKMFSEAVEIIRNEYYDSKVRLAGEYLEYELSNGQLIRKKR
ncbi:MAG: hypothetical protein KBS81_09690, partial [Spirochaetales bacterium]|nr:hypothetical protein [Candidatus Physcosoma equi]